MSLLKARQAGESAFLVDVRDGDPAGVRRAAAGIRQVAADRGFEVVDVVPGMSTVLISVRIPLALADFQRILAEVSELPAPAQEQIETITIDVDYTGPDLDEVARLTGLSVQEVIQLHSTTVYGAAFSGFAPGFAYLTGVPSALQVPRRPDPRVSVPSGSVALADQFTAVYPRTSPGGWRLIGTTDAVLWDTERRPAALIRPGAAVRFRPVPALTDSASREPDPPISDPSR
jgi:KipI family sensor histidine kinase inhibitor